MPDFSPVLCDSSLFYSDSDSSPFFSFSLWLGLGLRNRDSVPRLQAVATVPCCAVYSNIQYILLFVFMFWEINVEYMWSTRFVTRTRILFWLGLGLRGDNSDSTTWTRTQHCFSRAWSRKTSYFKNMRNTHLSDRHYNLSEITLP